MDHPQPLLERRRGDDSGSVDAFSRAILNEKDVAVRGTMENLRSQIAVIAARHGANARDVWNKEVQDSMSVDELDLVNALFARIKGISEKKLSRAQEREMLGELDRREAEAREVLERTVFSGKFESHEKSKLVDWFLRSGLIAEAAKFIGSDEVSERYVRISIAKAASLEDREFKSVRVNMLRSAVLYARTVPIVGPRDLSVFLDAYGAMLPLLSDEEIRTEVGILTRAGAGGDYRPIAFARLKMEIARRGLTLDARGVTTIDVLEQLTQGDIRASRSEHADIENLIISAEAAHSVGANARGFLQKAIDETKSTRAYDGFFDVVRMASSIAHTAARVGEWEIVDSLQAEDWWRDKMSEGNPDQNLYVGAAEGCAQTGNFDRAIAYLETPNFADDPDAHALIGTLANALFDADQIERGERLLARYADNEGDWLHEDTHPSYLAARARRGDDVLAIADARRSRMTLAAAAIGTIGYTVAMRKRIAEYASKR